MSETEAAERVAVIGLGYVGLPVAVAFAGCLPQTVGFDTDPRRVASLQEGVDHTGELSNSRLQASSLRVTGDPAALAGATFFVVTVPTPLNHNRQPDLSMVKAASRTVGRALSPGAVVVYESTVYPGVTEDLCRGILADVSGLTPGVDFKVAYSPERINPGDQGHGLERVIKVISAEDEATLDRIEAAYTQIVGPGLFRAASIRAAETAKLLENTQRDLNIALMNELSILCDRLGFSARDVLDAAGTKWNFMPFRPGLVGGHCIGVDPHYLAACAQSVGLHPEIILAGRRVNDSMALHVARKLVKLLARSGRIISECRVGILGVTYKENVTDIRNSLIPVIRAELADFDIDIRVHDPMADSDRAHHEYGFHLDAMERLSDLDALVLAVPHKAYLDQGLEALIAPLKAGGVLIDIASVFERDALPEGIIYWSL